MSLFLISIQSVFGQSLEQAQQTADQIIFNAQLEPLDQPQNINWNLFRLGEKLFFEKALSGNRNISCASCHSPKRYSADGLPLGVGQGATFSSSEIKLNKGAILKRHTPHLINVGHPDVKRLFWDGRVSQFRSNWETPLKDLSGDPLQNEMAQGFESILAVQSIFPLISPEEMMGYKGENEIAEQTTPITQWEKISTRLKSPLLQKKYRQLIKKAFSIDTKDLNIKHIGNSLAEYMTHFFASYQTPYDLYLQGDKSAMDIKGLKGMAVFFGKGRCFQCHNGKHLSNFQFMSSGAPQLTIQNSIDLGREEVNSRQNSRFLFKTTPLRNVALTAPYMHAGSLKSLEDVVNHYNDIGNSLSSYVLNEKWRSFYKDQVSYDADPERNQLRLLQVRLGQFITGLGLTSDEKSDLVYFLKESLTDQVFKRRMDLTN